MIYCPCIKDVVLELIERPSYVPLVCLTFAVIALVVDKIVQVLKLCFSLVALVCLTFAVIALVVDKIVQVLKLCFSLVAMKQKNLEWTRLQQQQIDRTKLIRNRHLVGMDL